MFRLTSCLAVLVVLIGVGYVSAETILPTPTHHYTFDVDASDSAGTNDGLLVAGASIVADPQRGMVLGLDGVNDYVALTSSSVPEGATDTSVFTIATWIKIPPDGIDSISRAYIYGEATEAGDQTKNTFFLGPEAPGATMSFDQFPASGSAIWGVSSLNDDRWHHVAYVQNELGSYKRKVYVDGELEAIDNSPERYSGSSPEWYLIGARFGGGHPVFPSHMKGRIDDLRFYDVALNGDQVRALVPEPSTLVLLGMGAAGLLAYARRRRR